MAGLSINMTSFLGLRQCFLAAAVVVCVLFCWPTTTTAMPMKNMVEEAVRRTRMEQQQQQQQLEEHERQKRTVSNNGCARPDNVAAMFDQINSQLGTAQFLKNFHDSSPSIPAGVDPNENKTCPSSLTSDSSAPLAHRSLCPYYIKAVVLPEGYYPASLPSAVCKCVKCVQHNAYGCEAVKTRIAVLKPLGCFQGLQRYEEQMIELNTGCVCATPGNTQPTTTSAPISTTSQWGVD